MLWCEMEGKDRLPSTQMAACEQRPSQAASMRGSLQKGCQLIDQLGNFSENEELEVGSPVETQYYYRRCRQVP